MSALRVTPALALAIASAACGGASTTATPTPNTAATSVIAATSSTCAQFAAGTAPVVAQLHYASNGTTITSVTPNEFTYWLKVTLTSAGLTKLTVSASTPGTPVHPQVRTGNAYVASKTGPSPCQPVSNSVTYVAGPATVAFVGTAGATYYINVQFSAQPYLGQVIATAGTVTVSTDGVANSSSRISVLRG